MTYSSRNQNNSKSDRLFRHKGDGTMKVAIYCRLSEEDRNKANREDDSNSIKNQDVICQGVFLQKSTNLQKRHTKLPQLYKR